MIHQWANTAISIIVKLHANYNIKLQADYNTNTLLDPNVVQCYFTCPVFHFIEFSACADIDLQQPPIADIDQQHRIQVLCHP